MNNTAAVPKRKMSLYDELFGPDPVVETDPVYSTDEIGAIEIEDVLDEKKHIVNRPLRFRLQRYAFFMVFSLIVGWIVGIVGIVGDVYLGSRLTKLNSQILRTESEVSQRVDGVGEKVTGVGVQVSGVSTQLNGAESRIIEEIRKGVHTEEEVAQLIAQNRQKDQKIATLRREKLNAIEEAARVKKELEDLQSSEAGTDDRDQRGIEPTR